MIGLRKIFMLFKESLECLFGGLVDNDIGDLVNLKIFGANDLIGLI